MDSRRRPRYDFDSETKIALDPCEQFVRLKTSGLQTMGPPLEHHRRPLLADDALGTRENLRLPPLRIEKQEVEASTPQLVERDDDDVLWFLLLPPQAIVPRVYAVSLQDQVAKPTSERERHHPHRTGAPTADIQRQQTRIYCVRLEYDELSDVPACLPQLVRAEPDMAAAYHHA